jgi:cob(I)alamin adenosyltransferase
MRITKVYTRTGDAGKTRLAGGQQVWKDSLRVEAYGTVDELNASVGVVRVFNVGGGDMSSEAERLEAELRWIQNKLFDIGGILATTPGQAFKNMPQVTARDVTRLEQLMDRCQKDLAPLKEFILPGGGRISGFLHQARTVCRRAERICVRLSREEPVDAVLIKYLNRLSDALFVLARWVSKTQGEPEFLWERDVKQKDSRQKAEAGKQ